MNGDATRPRRWALVTGGSRGIGAGVATLLAARGYAVVLTFRTRERDADGVVAAIGRDGGHATALRLDLADLPACASAAAALVERHGPPRAVVHCAGELLRASLSDTDTDALVRLFHVNVFSAFTLDRAFAPAMRAAGDGSITHVASVIGPAGARDRAAYAASKSALEGLTRALAVELAPAVRVNCLLPGLFTTEMNSGLLADGAALAGVAGRIPMNRLGDAGEAAAAAAFLAGDDASYVTGACLPVDGGLVGRLAVPSSDAEPRGLTRPDS